MDAKSSEEMKQWIILCRTLVRYAMEHQGTFIQAKILAIKKRKKAHADGAKDAYINKLEPRLLVTDLLRFPDLQRMRDRALFR